MGKYEVYRRQDQTVSRLATKVQGRSSIRRDQDPYTGWLMAYSETTLQQTSVLNLTPNSPSASHFSDGAGAVWMAGAGLAGDAQGNIFFLDGNGFFDSTMNTNGFPALGDFGNSFMKVSTTGNVLAPADYFAAYNLEAESDADQDLGSGGALLLPDQIDAKGNTRHLAVGAGKDTNIYVVDRDNMGKFNASSNNAIYQELPNALTGGAFSMPALLNNAVFYAGQGDRLKAFLITSASLSTSPVAESANTFPYPGATPSVSSNGRRMASCGPSRTRRASGSCTPMTRRTSRPGCTTAVRPRTIAILLPTGNSFLP